ncbi:unnamed protein product [Linum trigynum]|uniref:Uncharacterized protein n=1 Tax=Linum trigynum TaxID=586398 RepID=A0AAV2E4R1_9ROSI
MKNHVTGELKDGPTLQNQSQDQAAPEVAEAVEAIVDKGKVVVDTEGSEPVGGVLMQNATPPVEVETHQDEDGFTVLAGRIKRKQFKGLGHMHWR